MKSRIIRLQADRTTLRLDSWLSKHLPDLSRTRIQSLIKAGFVTINGHPVTSRSSIAAGNKIRIEVPPPQSTELVAQDIPLTVIHEDQDIIVINKQSGLVVHPAPGHSSGTLVNALLHHCNDLAGIGGELRPGIVHRLDKDTSGIMIIAKNEKTMTELMRQFKSGSVHKEYIAIVHGTPNPSRGRITTCIGRSARDRKKMAVTTRMGRNAVTNYEVMETFSSSSLLRLHIETGRTHQIRVHLSYVGHPVVGDKQYGGGKCKCDLPIEIKRQLLHAELLAFIHPATGKQMSFKASMPDDMKTVIEMLKATR